MISKQQVKEALLLFYHHVNPLVCWCKLDHIWLFWENASSQACSRFFWWCLLIYPDVCWSAAALWKHLRVWLRTMQAPEKQKSSITDKYLMICATYFLSRLFMICLFHFWLLFKEFLCAFSVFMSLICYYYHISCTISYTVWLTVNEWSIF